MDHPPAYREIQEEEVETVEKLGDIETPPYEESDEHTKAPLEQAESSTSTTSYIGRGPKLDSVPIDESKVLQPNRMFWIPWFNVFSKEIKVHDLSSQMVSHWQGSVNKEFRDLAKAMFDKYHKGDKRPCYTAEAQDVIRHHFSVKDSKGIQVVDWKHGAMSSRDVHLSFPSSTHISAPVDIIKANKTFTRDRVFTWNGTMYAIEMDHAWRSNQFSLFKLVNEQKYPVARYGMKFGSAWFVGGAVVIDSNEVDELVAVLACLVIIKQNKQRAAERGSHGGGGGGP